MAIGSEEVKHVAGLAKLAFKDEELAKFIGQMDEIINMVQQLSEVDTTELTITTHVTVAVITLREDVAVKGTDRDLLMKNVPQSQDEYIKVLAIIDESEE